MGRCVAEVIRALERFAPPVLAVPGDPAGLACGDPASEVTRVYFAMDAGFSALEAARRVGAQMVVCHHPRLFRPLASLAETSFEGRLATAMIRSGLAVYSAHSALDLAPGGVADTLAGMAGLKRDGVKTFDIAVRLPYWKLTVFVPESHLEPVRLAVAEAGAGSLGAYSACSFRTMGTGTFLPRKGARPFVGRVGAVAEVTEWRLETLVPGLLKDTVEAAVREAHPYEEPAFDFVALDRHEEFGYGRAGELERPDTLYDWAVFCRHMTGSTAMQYLGDPERPLRRVGVMAGSANHFPEEVVGELALDAVAVGEMDYHARERFASTGAGLVILGHDWSERDGVGTWADSLRLTMPEVAVTLEQPPAGLRNAWNSPEAGK